LNVTFFQSTNKKAAAIDEISPLAAAQLLLEKQ
jgi:hypothetical protein